MKKSLAIIIPVFRSTQSVELLTGKIRKLFQGVCPYHIYLIDDGNDRKVLEFLKACCLKGNTTLVSLYKNYGQQNAVLCGLKYGRKFDYTAVLDDDLEHPPEKLLSMYQMMGKGYDLVYAIPDHPGCRPIGSQIRDFLFRAGVKGLGNKRVSSFRMMTREVADDVTKDVGDFFYFSAAALKKPRRVGNITYRSRKRPYGKSGYDFRKKASLLLNIIRRYYLPERIVAGAGEKGQKPLYRIKAVYPRLMVLGGSNCQLHALERAAEQDIQTILADYTKCPPGARAASIHERISTFDVPACILAAKKHKVQGIMTMGTDQPVYTAAEVSRALDLPSQLTPRQAFSVTNKKAMKQILAGHGIKTAAWTLIDKQSKENALEGLKPPYVIKPLDSQGQRGIYKLSGAREVLDHLNHTLSFSRCQEALVEEYYQSDEVTVSGYIEKGKLTVLTITDRLLYPDPVHIGVCIGHRFPSVHMDRYEEICALSQRLTDAFGLMSGPFYLQILIGQEGIRVNELACRIGGAFEDVIIPWLTGFDILKAVMDASLGIPMDFSPYRGFRCDQQKKAAAIQLMFCRPGRIQKITQKAQLEELPFLLDCGFNYKEGDRIPVMENATARFGHGVITGTQENISRHINEFYEKIQVLSEHGENLLKRMYPL